MRAREPAVSPDAKEIVFVKLSGGKTQLARIKLGPKPSAEVIFTPPIQYRISYPLFLNEKEILFSMRTTSGSEYLYKMNLSERKPIPVLTDYPNARFATMLNKKIYFTSSRNGTHNIYQTDSELKTAHPISHTLTALFSFTMDPQSEDVYSTHMSAGGANIIVLKKVDCQKTPAELPHINGLLADRYPAQTSTVTSGSDKKIPFEITDYSAAGYLWPQYWIPLLASSTSNNGLVLQATTSGFDPLKKHTYNILGAWDTGINRGSLQGSYLNQQTSLPVLLSLYQLNSYLGTVDNRLTDTGGSLGILPSTFGFSPYSSLQLGWQYFERQIINANQVKRTGPYAILAYTDFTQAERRFHPNPELAAI